jgi:type I restriction enzyme M protein
MVKSAPRAAGKGRNPPEWLGMYFVDSPSQWFSARHNDVVFSSIDLWQGCISVVPAEFDRAIVTKEFPIYEVVDDRLSPEFLSCLLRSRYYQRAFRAITTGHSNRRRTQREDFENLEICFPPVRADQQRLVIDILRSRTSVRQATQVLHDAYMTFSDRIDGRGAEELPEIGDHISEGDNGYE